MLSEVILVIVLHSESPLNFIITDLTDWRSIVDTAMLKMSMLWRDFTTLHTKDVVKYFTPFGQAEASGLNYSFHCVLRRVLYLEYDS